MEPPKTLTTPLSLRHHLCLLVGLVEGLGAGRCLGRRVVATRLIGLAEHDAGTDDEEQRGSCGGDPSGRGPAPGAVHRRCRAGGRRGRVRRRRELLPRSECDRELLLAEIARVRDAGSPLGGGGAACMRCGFVRYPPLLCVI